MNTTKPDAGAQSPLKRAYRALEAMQAKIERLEAARSAPVAIVGMSCRFPGADNTDEYWRLLQDGVHAVGEIPDGRWDVDALYDPDPEAEGKMYTRHGGFLEEVAEFDAPFFGISPREAIHLDPQQRLLLEVTWEALQEAGAVRERLSGQSMGVFIGVTSTDYAQYSIQHRGLSDIDTYHITGNTLNAAAGRLSYCFGFQGPCVAVDTACSSSLSALHQAVRALQRGECEAAVAGGVNLMLSPLTYIALSKTSVLSPSGQCRAFDADADGMVRGEGCGVVVLKPLEAARRDGDRVLAVIRGSAVNQDGPSSGLTVPNGPAQESLIKQALADARLEPEQIDYIEAHGTGTSLGDPIELRALASVYASRRQPDDPLWIGSVKTNIGHLEAAAGIAGIIKLALMLQHRRRAPQLHFKTPTPHFDWQRHPIQVSTSLEPFTSTEPIRCGVSSFGFSGMNAHIILEEAPRIEAEPSEFERPLDVLALSAHSQIAFSELARRTASRLEALPAEDWKNFCYSTNHGRGRLDHRLALVADSPQHARRQLTDWLNSGAAAGLHQGFCDSTPSIAFLFTGQGAQYVGMGQRLYQHSPEFKSSIDACESVFHAETGASLIEVMFGDDANLIHRTDFAQPALFAIEYALGSLLQSWGVTPSAMIGHSVGEYAAACLAGVMSLEDAVRLIAARGRLIHSAPGDGAMAAVMASRDVVEQRLGAHKNVSLAAVNSNNQTVISGERGAVEALVESFSRDGIRAVPLQTSHAFHSPLMEPALEPFREIASTIRFAAPQLLLICGMSGEFADANYATADRWTSHIRKPVLFQQALETLKTLNPDVLIEIGPKPILTPLALSVWEEGGIQALPSLRSAGRDWEDLLDSLSALFVSGAAIDWRAFDRPYARSRVSTPRYPFQRQRYWLADEGITSSAAIQKDRRGGGWPGRLLDTPGASEFRHQAAVSLRDFDWLNDHSIYGVVVLPAAMAVELLLQAVRAMRGEAAGVEIQTLSFHAPCMLAAESMIEFQTVLKPESDGGFLTTIYFNDRSSESNWCEYVSGRVKIDEAMSIESFRPADESTMPVACQTLDLYQSSQRRGVCFGPAFQAVQSLRCSGREASSSLALPARHQRCDSFLLHPVLLDGCFQTLGALFLDQPGDALFLPVQIERLRVKPFAGMSAQARVIDRSASSSDMLTFDFGLFDEGGDAFVSIESMRFVEASPEQFAQRSASGSLFYQPVWRRNDGALSDVAAEERWLILSDRDDLAAQICDRLSASGCAADALPIKSAIEESQMAEADHALVSFIGQARSNDEGAAMDDALASVESLLNALHSFLAHAHPGACFWVVTRNAMPVIEADAVEGFAQAALWGAMKSVMHEHPERSIRLIDLDDAGANDLAGFLNQERSKRALESFVAYRSGQRHVLRLAQQEMPSQPLSLSRDSICIISGGTGGLGLQIAKRLAEAGAGELVLLSRSGRVKETEKAALDAIRSTGVEINIEACDISSSGQVEALVHRKAGGRAIHGVVHCAGVLDDGPIENQSVDRFRTAFAPKLQGALNLWRATEGQPLQFMAFFSSLSSVWGAKGQANYAAANSVLDSLAWRLRAKGVPAFSLNWGPWSEIGMAARLDLVTALKREGLAPMTPQEGVDAFAHAVAGSTVQCAIARLDLFSIKERLGGEMPPLLEELAVSAAIPSLKRDGDATGSRDSGPEWDASDGDASMRAILSDAVCRILRINPESFDPEAPLNRLGVDSLMAVELRNQLRKRLGIDAPIAWFIDGSSTESAASRLALRAAEQSEPAVANEAKTDIDALTPEEASQLLERLDELSDEDVEALLAKTMKGQAGG